MLINFYAAELVSRDNLINSIPDEKKKQLDTISKSGITQQKLFKPSTLKNLFLAKVIFEKMGF